MTSSKLKVLAAKVMSQHKTFKRGLSNQTVEEVVSALLLSASQADKIAELEISLCFCLPHADFALQGQMFNAGIIQAKKLLENEGQGSFTMTQYKALKEGK
jgi:hypothetical protein